MPNLATCPTCGGSIPLAAPQGLCPRCLLRLARDATPRPEDTPDDRTGPYDPRTTSGLRAGDTTTDRPPDARGDAIPAVLDDYELIEELGRGGMGVVFKAVQRLTERVVAVKVLPGGAVGGRVRGDRFDAEVQALARLRHPNVIDVYGGGESAGLRYFAMEYAPGGTLARRLKAGPLPPAEVAAVVAGLAGAVEAAHRLGVVHRDIKPANVLLTADGTPKLSDFGLAKRTDLDAGLTATGVVVGTPSYMAPEQAAGKGEGAIDERTDVYALGATLYELLTGRPPFRGDDSHQTIRMVLSEDPVPPRKLAPGVPADLEAVCLKCLEKDPRNRYQSAQALADDLARWRQGESTVARPHSRPRRVWRRVRRWARRRPKAVGAILALPLALVVLAGVWVVTRPPTPREELERAFGRNERVVLLGDTGPPRYQRWVGGPGEVSAGATTFQIFCVGTGMLELAPDCPWERYRLSAEFHPEASVKPDSWSGVYFAYRTGTPDPAGVLDRALLVRFREDWVNRKPRDQRQGDPVNVVDFLLIREGDKPLRPAHLPACGVHWVAQGERSFAHEQPWRRVVVEVTPERLRAFWQDPDGRLRPIGPSGRPDRSIPAATLHGATEDHREQLRRDYPGLAAEPPVHATRGGLGLYACDARVSFRNVFVEPLPESPNP